MLVRLLDDVVVPASASLGSWGPSVVPTWTHDATEGTPAPFMTKSMYQPGGALFPFGGAVAVMCWSPSTVHDRST
jgi:hypothetical protein